MAHPNLEKKEKLVDLTFKSEDGKEDLYKNLSIWRVHIDSLREQDKNARVMTPEKFERLTENIKLDKRLESLPYVMKFVNPAGSEEFQIISGHHRVRTARKAGLEEMVVLVEEGDLTRSQVVSKQLAHNALTGSDDQSILQELYLEIEDIEEKIRSGITDQEIKIDNVQVKVDDLMLDLEYENIHMLFLPKSFEKFEEMIDNLEEDSKVYIADKKEWEGFKDIMQKTSKQFDVRNVSAIMVKLVEVMKDYYKKNPVVEKEDKPKEEKKK